MQIHHLDQQAQAAARRQWNSIAKPLNSLGLMEDMLVQIAGIQQTPDIRLDKRCVLVFCADHGVVAQGVTQSGQEVTALVAQSIAEGTANINLMAAVARADVFPVDMGMGQEVPGPLPRRIAPGTQDMTQGPAMTRPQAEKALQTGIDLVGEMKAQGYHLIATGEMGIGNTTAAAALTCVLTGITPMEATGRGAGLSDSGLKRKLHAVTQALEVNRPDPNDPVDVLARVGGFEIAAMAGAFLGGMIHQIPVVMDGVISQAAALIALKIHPEARDFILPSHMSREPAGQKLMAALGMTPMVDAKMALGEGTGAVTLFPLLDMAHRVYAGPHTFKDLGMDAYRPQEGQP